MRLEQHNNTAKDYRRARELRNNASPVEVRFWGLLKEAAKAAGVKFRRQQALHPYIADFACMEARLLVEIDGDSHSNRKTYDRKRDMTLRKMGFDILRFTNDDVIKNTEGVVCVTIGHALRLIHKTEHGLFRNAPLPDPPHEGEGIIRGIGHA